MYLPPAAAWDVGRTQWQRRALLALVALDLLVSAGFCYSQRWSSTTFFLLLLNAACAGFAATGLRRGPRGKLRWDGGHWYWSAEQDHAVLQLACVMDLQRCMLLRVACLPGANLWLWLESPSMSEPWLALRRAVVAGRDAPQAQSLHSLPE